MTYCRQGFRRIINTSSIACVTRIMMQFLPEPCSVMAFELEISHAICDLHMENAREEIIWRKNEKRHQISYKEIFLRH